MKGGEDGDCGGTGVGGQMVTAGVLTTLGGKCIKRLLVLPVRRKGNETHIR